MGHQWRVKNPWNLKLFRPEIIDWASEGRLTACFLLLLIKKERFWQTRIQCSSSENGFVMQPLMSAPGSWAASG